MVEIEMFVVYDSPTDFPGEFIVRRHVVKNGRNVPDLEVFARATSLAEARATLRPGLTNVGRYADDVESIVEVWV